MNNLKFFFFKCTQNVISLFIYVSSTAAVQYELEKNIGNTVQEINLNQELNQ